MNIFLEPHKHMLTRLIEFNVDFILVGGYAVNYHGYNRATGDMDIWLRPDNSNRQAFLELLKADGFDENSLSHVSQIDFTKAVAFHVGEKPLQIDFLTKLSGVKYDEVLQKKETFHLDNIKIPVIHLDDLIVSKIATGRLRDKNDVEELQKILRLKKKM
ncbi:MAG TPA: nucleotidyltransferase [Cyclobacteriaceae bacterium]|nr:nucleotidyltransferase [Cyclobacteriaceae bacterium]